MRCPGLTFSPLKQDRAKRQEEEAILDLYLSALGEV